jgi:RHS repeat-associated protein
VDYDAFGNGGTVTGYGFTGREFDPETGLLYYRARYYDPKIGRFISEDPIGLSAGINFYSYVYNDPVNLVDPFGLLGARGPQPNPRPAPPPPPPPGTPARNQPLCVNCPPQVSNGFNQVCWQASFSAPPQVSSCIQSLCNPGPNALPNITCSQTCPQQPKTFGMGGPGSGITVCVPAATSGSQCFTNNVIYHELLHKCVPNSMAPPNHAFIFNTAFQAFSCGE